MFHHDPSHDDDQLDGLLCHARTLAAQPGVGPGPGASLDVVSAYEGLSLSV